MNLWNRCKSSSDLRRWLGKEGEETLRKIGVIRGQTLLDFGCSEGNYTIPAARIVGEEGKVYALDKNKQSLDLMIQKADAEGLKNIRSINTSGKIKIVLDDESIDFVLLYDIFIYFSLTQNKLSKLLAEVYRVSKPNAIISVYPKHTDSVRLKNKLEYTGFKFKEVYS